MKSKEIKKTLKQLSKDTIKEIKRLYPLVSINHYDNDLEYIEIDRMRSEYNETACFIGIKKDVMSMEIVVEDEWGISIENLLLEDTTIGDKLYILEELERLSKPKKKK